MTHSNGDITPFYCFLLYSLVLNLLNRAKPFDPRYQVRNFKKREMEHVFISILGAGVDLEPFELSENTGVNDKAKGEITRGTMQCGVTWTTMVNRLVRNELNRLVLVWTSRYENSIQLQLSRLVRWLLDNDKNYPGAISHFGRRDAFCDWVAFSFCVQSSFVVGWYIEISFGLYYIASSLIFIWLQYDSPVCCLKLPLRIKRKNFDQHLIKGHIQQRKHDFDFVVTCFRHYLSARYSRVRVARRN